MAQHTAKRLTTVLLGLVLPVAVVIVILTMALRNAYLSAADSFGREFGDTMVRQAQNDTAELTAENWDDLRIAAASLPQDFSDWTVADRAAWLQKLTADRTGRSMTFYYYSMDGECSGSDGTSAMMHYTSRSDLSAILAGAEERAIYGPLYDEEADSDDAAAQKDANAERSGYSISYTVPVKSEDGRVAGALSLKRDAYEYCDALSSLSLGAAGYTYLVDGAQTVIAVSRAEQLAQVTGEADHAGQSTPLAALEAKALAGQAGSASLTAQQTGAGEGASVFALPVSFSESEGDGLPTWAVVVYLPNSDLEGYLSSQASKNATSRWITALSVILLVVLAVLFLLEDTIRARKNETARKATEYRDVLEQTMRALAGTYECRSVPDPNHGYRVAALSQELGSHLGLSELEQQKLYFEAVLHDIGMIAVPEEVLRHEQEGKMTPGEALCQREHVTVGGRILGKLTALPEIGVGAMYHHQNYDGSGYCSADAAPVRGSDIPLSARVIHVADSCDRFLQKNKNGLEGYLESGRGKQFDPVIADLMIQLARDGTVARLSARTEEELRTGTVGLAQL